ncbi:DoxX family protein [Luteimonas huabeiensis]|uniref:DoxX family protein n=1 Tax=Luteimonas huabeiensis TaxID=1244513 RepID=UPI0004677F6F|nr:DoxX family protein [Luteimonas huabeiensis]
MNQAAMQDLGRLLLRLAVGVLVLLHGLAKLRHGVDGIEGMLEARGLPGALAYLSLVGEVVAPLMLIIGLHARIGGAIVAINMLVAIALVHMRELGRLNDSGGWALELQAMFLVGAIVVALIGPGRYSANQR